MSGAKTRKSNGNTSVKTYEVRVEKMNGGHTSMSGSELCRREDHYDYQAIVNLRFIILILKIFLMSKKIIFQFFFYIGHL